MSPQKLKVAELASCHSVPASNYMPIHRPRVILYIIVLYSQLGWVLKSRSFALYGINRFCSFFDYSIWHLPCELHNDVRPHILLRQDAHAHASNQRGVKNKFTVSSQEDVNKPAPASMRITCSRINMAAPTPGKWCLPTVIELCHSLRNDETFAISAAFSMAEN